MLARMTETTQQHGQFEIGYLRGTYTAAQLALVIGVSVDDVLAAARRGRLPGMPVGAGYLFDGDTVTALIRSHSRQTTELQRAASSMIESMITDGGER